MENKPTQYPEQYVSYYKSERLSRSPFLEAYNRDKQLLNEAGIDFSVEEINGFTFICVEGCSSYELAQEILG